MQSEMKSCTNCKISQSYAIQTIPEVVTLNVGGCIFTTSLATLQKSSHSMLAAMFSGRHSLVTDSNGRFFIDRNGSLFEHILNFLRQEQLPPLNVSLKVYEEAEFFNLVDMCTALEVLKPVASKKLRQKFLDQVPFYYDKVSLLISEAQRCAFLQPDRISKIKVSIFKEEQHLSPHEVNKISQANENGDQTSLQHKCDVNVIFGIWKGSPGVYDLLGCIKNDLELKGYDFECQCIGVCDQHIWGQHFCKRPIFEFKFRWW